jgi:MerR family transcriptional regulator, light-induced transcriptional regulator
VLVRVLKDIAMDMENTRLSEQPKSAAKARPDLPFGFGQSVTKMATDAAQSARDIGRRMLRAGRNTSPKAHNQVGNVRKALMQRANKAITEPTQETWAIQQAGLLAAALANDHDVSSAAWLDTLFAGPLAASEIGFAVFGPAAAQLGQMWLDDQVSFNQVGLGMWRLRRLHEDLRDRLNLQALAGNSGDRAKTILLSATPGENHSFGLSLVAGFFEDKGWFAEALPNDAARTLIAEVMAREVDVVGLTLSRADLVAPLTELIGHLRTVSRNPNLVVIVGGGYVTALADAAGFALQIGADAALADARDAVEQVTQLLPVSDTMQAPTSLSPS